MIYHQSYNSQVHYSYDVCRFDTLDSGLHFHTNYELIRGQGAGCRVTVNGTAVTVADGMLLLIPPCAVHRVQTEPGGRIWIGIFSEDYVQDFARKYRSVVFSPFRCSLEAEAFLARSLFASEEPPERFLLKACLYLVCGECAKRAAVLSAGQDPTFVQRVVSYVTAEPEAELTARQTAEALGYEYHYFSALFHRCFSMNFREFLHISRFEDACRLLREEADSITEIGSRCGFGTIRNFNRVFKRLSGQTPSEYRREQQKRTE